MIYTEDSYYSIGFGNVSYYYDFGKSFEYHTRRTNI